VLVGVVVVIFFSSSGTTLGMGNSYVAGEGIPRARGGSGTMGARVVVYPIVLLAVCMDPPTISDSVLRVASERMISAADTVR
jgi:hypothetical protein